MTLQSVIEVILALAAVLLLARDLRRAWLDRLRRPITLLIAALVAVLLVGMLGGRAQPRCSAPRSRPPSSALACCGSPVDGNRGRGGSTTRVITSAARSSVRKVESRSPLIPRKSSPPVQPISCYACEPCSLSQRIAF